MTASDTRPGPHVATIASAFAGALKLAAARIGVTAPNPPVGCVLLDADGNVLAEAAHQAAGQPHAEALAIERSRTNGTIERLHSVVVTLEPCNHTGRTPPCTTAILGTPARHAWIGATDPNPAVTGGGATALRAAGLLVRSITDLDTAASAQLAAEAARLIAPFSKRVRTGRPWVVVKQALDVHGSMRPPRGRTTFTSASSLVLAHRLRREADALLTGSGTILADNPAFTVRRVPDFPGRRRQLLIMDRRGRVPASYLEAAAARGFDVRIETDLLRALAALGATGCLQVLVEAGVALTRDILDAGLWDEHITIQQCPDGDDRVSVRYRDVTGRLTAS